MPPTELTTALKVAVLKHLLHDRNNEFITAATGLTNDQVNEVKRDHGYPEVEKMKWALDILEKKAGELPKSEHPAPRPARPAATARPLTTTPAAPPQGVILHHTATTPDTLVEQLVVRAKASTKASTRKLGERVQALVEQLRTTVTAEDEARRAAEQAARADAERQRQIADLEAKLAELRGTPVKKHATSTPNNGEAKKIREWAADNGVECPKVGRIPTAVREAYEAAHAEDAA